MTLFTSCEAAQYIIESLSKCMSRSEACKCVKGGIDTKDYYYFKFIVSRQFESQEYAQKLEELKENLARKDERGTAEKNRMRYAYTKIKKWDKECAGYVVNRPPKVKYSYIEMGKLKIAIQPYTYWNMTKIRDKFGLPYPGRIPADIIFNLLYFFTKQGDLVVDPMAGGGVTGDVCKKMKRRCLMYDVDVKRKDVINHDIRRGLPKECSGAALLFWDPPYYKKMQAHYNHKDSISALPRNDYLEIFGNAVKDFKGKHIKTVAFLMSDFIDYNNSKNSIFIWEYIEIFKDAGWMPIYDIQVPIAACHIRAPQAVKYKKDCKLHSTSRDLIVFQEMSI
jgi:hypothetical protein